MVCIMGDGLRVVLVVSGCRVMVFEGRMSPLQF